MDNDYADVPTYKEAVRIHDREVRNQVCLIWWGYHDALVNQLRSLNLDYRLHAWTPPNGYPTFDYFEVIS